MIQQSELNYLAKQVISKLREKIWLEHGDKVKPLETILKRHNGCFLGEIRKGKIYTVLSVLGNGGISIQEVGGTWEQDYFEKIH